VDLLPLKADSSYGLRQQHYSSAIELLTKALDDSLFAEESTNDNNAESYAKKHGLENLAARFELNWDKTVKRDDLRTEEKTIKEIQANFDIQNLV